MISKQKKMTSKAISQLSRLDTFFLEGSSD